MLRWWVDDTDFQSEVAVGTPDVFVLGGVIATQDQSRDLAAAIDAIRTPYGGPRLPLKWNFKDAERFYSRDQKLLSLYDKLREDTASWRGAVFDAIGASGVQILVTAIEAYSPERDKVKELRTELMRWVFTMGLSRFGLHVKNSDQTSAEVVLDWPPRNEREPINIEYRSAFVRGASKDGQRYHSGPLKEIGFADAPLFATMQYACMLQVADLVVGATRDFMRGARQGKFGPGLDCLRRVRHCFRGAPGAVESQGLVVSPGNAGFRESVRRAIKHDLFDEPRADADDVPF